MSNGLTFEILIQILQNFQGRHRNTLKDSLQNFMEIDLELTEKSAKNTQRWWKLTATIDPGLMLRLIGRIGLGIGCPTLLLAALGTKGRTMALDIWGGPRVVFLSPRENNLYFWRLTSDNFFFMFSRRNFLLCTFPIMYVTIWCFFCPT